jgi:hypothetical protein
MPFALPGQTPRSNEERGVRCRSRCGAAAEEAAEAMPPKARPETETRRDASEALVVSRRAAILNGRPESRAYFAL